MMANTAYSLAVAQSRLVRRSSPCAGIMSKFAMDNQLLDSGVLMALQAPCEDQRIEST